MSNINIINRDVLAAPFSTKNIIIPRLLSSSARNIPNGDILNYNSIRRVSGGTAVEIILLNVDAVLRYIRNANIFVKDVRYEASSVGVAFDARAVLSIEDDGVGEGDVCDVVVGLAADGADGEAVATGAVHVGDVNIVAAGYSYL
jgi:hypothetical protein